MVLQAHHDDLEAKIQGLQAAQNAQAGLRIKEQNVQADHNFSALSLNGEIVLANLACL